MKNSAMIATGIASAILCGCGGDSGEGSTGIVLNESLKGLESTPELTTVTSGVVSLNSLVKGSVLDGGVDRWQFISDISGDVLLTLSSSAEDLDLAVSGNTVQETSDSFSSDEWIIFAASAGESYELQVDSYTGEGNYELEVAVPNRESFGLNGTEFLYEISSAGVENCDGDERSYNSTYYVVIDWSRGRLGSGDERVAFDGVSGTQVTINYSEEESEPEFDSSYEYSGTTVLNVNEETGILSGTDDWSSVEIDDGDISNCSYKETLSGVILL